MKYLQYLFFFSLVLFMLTGCPDKADDNISIRIKNQTDKDILFVRGGNKYTECTDDSLPDINIGTIVKANTSVYNNLVLNKCNTYLYILSIDTVNKYSWEDIRKNDRYMKKYIISSESDLKKIDYTITYP
ncbi:hypothetical protein M2451_004158 [Dysgonomonas sp. PFB1-18]|uniref:hypothetical protein n=1 Tax=unclassified Dysgonomonas TaxID=2630389 RepID=UPI00247635CA|nr:MULTISPECIES: hypothetical protein [unclassified Dysgonomonas]MDH6307241.1 hypothetical protein [Dysgonomonas sp. PF1-14]MDH6337159.1 hypothetical protein [Dysgonomonas sp. PF1-16]MDH6382807.1 hypothetical protein [Dysgonomonas sp. PFB1-18]MDH6396280.1 hypothetical protein [Dysgonomonas sp. PF1-23]